MAGDFDVYRDLGDGTNWSLLRPTTLRIRTLGLLKESKGIDVCARHIITTILNQLSIFNGIVPS